jgi:hypothetical protein
MLHMFYNGYRCFFRYVLQVFSYACFKCFICLHMYIASVASLDVSKVDWAYLPPRLLLPRHGVSSSRCWMCIWTRGASRRYPLLLFSMLMTFERRGPRVRRVKQSAGTHVCPNVRALALPFLFSILVTVDDDMPHVVSNYLLQEFCTNSGSKEPVQS